MSGPWWTNAFFYGLDVDVFFDSEGDGHGDFRGAVEKLDYIRSLGANALWILPFFRGPNRDNRYDVADHYGIAPEVGTMGDFLLLVEEAHKRGLRVLVDIIVNHTSNEHPWFERSRQDPGSRYRGYYVWSRKIPPLDEQNEPIFTTVEWSVWTFDREAGLYYYHSFYRFQPDLDLSNPDVQAEVTRLLSFWFGLGIDGARLDAATHFFDDKGGRRPKQGPALLRDFLSAARRRQPEAMLMGEADLDLDALGPYLAPDRLQLLFNFHLSQHIFLALAREEAEPIARSLRELPPRPPGCQWLNFLRNLDELDLERLTEAEREEVYRAFAPDEGMRAYDRGIRRRLAPMLGHDIRRLQQAFSLLFSLPGVPLVVYGDEIGMGENLALPERNAVRTPMQWSDEEHGGFSTARCIPREPLAEGPGGYRATSVAQQEEDAHSLLQFVRHVSRLRERHPSLGLEDPEILPREDGAVLVLRYSDLLCAHNLASRAARVRVPAQGAPEPVLAGGARATQDGDGWLLDLEPYAFAWLRPRPNA